MSFDKPPANQKSRLHYLSPRQLAACQQTYPKLTMHIVFLNQKPFLFGLGWETQLEANDWLFSLSRNANTRSPHTWRAYAYDLGDWLCWCAREGQNWRIATQNDTQRYISSFVVADNTVNRHVAALVSFYRWALERGVVARLPFSNRGPTQYCAGNSNHQCSRTTLHRRIANERIIRVPSVEDVRRLISAAASYRDRLIIQTIALTGLRISEVVSLRASLFTSIGLSQYSGAVLVEIMGKGMKRRQVFFPLSLIRDIQHWIDLERRYIAPKLNSDQLYLGRGGTLGTAQIETIFRELSQSTSILVWPHLLRHFFACHRLKYLTDCHLCNPLGQLKAELGHSSIATTSRYLHLTDEVRARVAADHETFLSALVTGTSPVPRAAKFEGLPTVVAHIMESDLLWPRRV